MNKRIITIGRQCGSGGHTIGEAVAERLGVPLYDKKILEIVAQRSGLSEKTIEAHGEHTTSSLIFNLASSISYGYDVSSKGAMVLPDQINAFQTELIRELADKEPCVIIGRCSDYVLRDRDDCLHVFVHGNLDERARRAIKEYGVSEAEAHAHVKDRDKKRARHYKHVTERMWGMAENYDLCLDSSEFGLEGCIEAILGFARSS